MAKGVRQGWNIYTEKIFQLALNGNLRGIKVKGIPINNLCYADDTAFLTDKIEDLQAIVNVISAKGKKFGFNIKKNKSKLMIVSTDNLTTTKNFATITRLRGLSSNTWTQH